MTVAARLSALAGRRADWYADRNGQAPGGVVIGGGCQGLGIARSLGQHGIPVCVVDDETSIARASRFVQKVVRVRDLRSEASLLGALAEARKDLGRSRWVLYPTRDETVFLPFDPGEVMQRFWSERYREVGRSPLTTSAQRAMVSGCYLLRPTLPRQLQLSLRRVFSHVQGRASFSSWPIEDSLHNLYTLYTWLFARLSEVASRPVPFLGVWPDGRSWALVLTHDVETSAGIHNMELLRDIERQLGYRSSWNFVPLRYRVEEGVVRALRADGCEIGVHGLRHDGRDLGSRRLMEKRLPAMREYAERWNAVGFRSPATQRQWELMPRLGFEYDSSYTDTDPYEPQPGGCCTCLPYFNENMVELPITLPQDHTMFRILRASDTNVWIRKAERLRERHSMALAQAHPDYARDPRVLEGYRKLLEAFQRDAAVWHALPAEVAKWWRQRDASRLRRDGSIWRIEGPGATNGQVRFAAANGAVRC